MSKKIYGEKYDVKIAEMLFTSRMSVTELCNKISLVYQRFNRSTLTLHLKKLKERGLIMRGDGTPNVSRKAGYQLTEKGRILYILEIIPEKAARRQRKLLCLLLLFNVRNKTKDSWFTLHDFMMREQYDFDLNDDNIEHVEIEVPTGSDLEPEWQWESLGELGVPYDKQEVMDALENLVRVGLFTKRLIDDGYAYSIIDQDFQGLIWTIWFLNFLYYGKLRNWWKDRGQPTRQERIWLGKYVGRKNAEDILREPYSTQSRILTSNEVKKLRRMNQSDILHMLKRRSNIQFDKKDLRKVVVMELLSKMFDYDSINDRLRKLESQLLSKRA